MQKETNIKTYKTGLRVETYQLTVFDPAHDDEGNITMPSLIRALFREADELRDRKGSCDSSIEGMDDLLQPLIFEAAKRGVSSRDILYSVFNSLHYANCKSDGFEYHFRFDDRNGLVEAAVQAACDEVTR